MLLYPVKGTGLGQGAENVSRDVALEAAEDLALGEALGGAPAGVCLSALVAAHPDGQRETGSNPLWSNSVWLNRG